MQISGHHPLPKAAAEQLHDFLYQRDPTLHVPSEDMLEWLTPDTFYVFLEDSIDNDDEATVREAISLFTLYTDVEFREPNVSEQDLLKMTSKISREIDDFIFTNSLAPRLHLLGATELYQLHELYNRNNLLFLAKNLAEQSELDLQEDGLLMLYRYRVTLKRFEEIGEQLGCTQSETERQSDNNVKDGARTWAGVVRAYGVETGFIDQSDARHFSEDAAYEDLPDVVTLHGGDTVRLSSMFSVDREPTRGGPDDIRDLR